MSPRVFLDTGVFVAFLNRRDRWHDQSVALFSGRRPRWCSSALVRSEAYSFFLHKYGEESARSFRLMFDQLDGLTIYDADAEHHIEVVKILERFRGTKLTYVDASSLALIGRYKIKNVWSTDHHLGLTGAEVVPRS